MPLGEHIRAFRLEQGLTASELARRTEVSTSLISQVERGTSSPSVDVLQRIARALDIHIGELFDGPTDVHTGHSRAGPNGRGNGGHLRGGAGRARLVRHDARKTISLPSSRVRYELLSPDLQGRLEFILAEYAPGEVADPVAFSHEGEESWHVVRGTAQFHFGDEIYVLEAGDTITFDSSVPHRAVNPGDEPLVAISAGTPPSF